MEKEGQELGSKYEDHSPQREEVYTGSRHTKLLSPRDVRYLEFERDNTLTLLV